MKIATELTVDPPRRRPIPVAGTSRQPPEPPKISPYRFLIVRNGRDVANTGTVDAAFSIKEPGDSVFVELMSTGYRARVLRPG